jgi:hypothetical protein
MDDRSSIPGKIRGVSLRHLVPTDFGVHLFPYSMAIGKSPVLRCRNRVTDLSPTSSTSESLFSFMAWFSVEKGTVSFDYCTVWCDCGCKRSR